MKYMVLIGDGMSDYPLDELNGRTPLEAAKIPNISYIAQHGVVARATTVPRGMSPASDIANLSIMGYDPKKYYTGRGPLEAANIGVDLDRDDVALLHFKQVYPLPEETAEYLHKAKKTINVENNATSQFPKLIKLQTGIDIDKKILKYNGLSFFVEELTEKLKEALN